jgi:hypothetical protein
VAAAGTATDEDPRCAIRKIAWNRCGLGGEQAVKVPSERHNQKPAMPDADKQRSEALGLYTEHGPGETSRRTGIPRSTISRWGSDEGLDGPRQNREGG